ncbi:MAG: alpha/beta fold hydrolase [Thermoleophilaceae bacterium]
MSLHYVRRGAGEPLVLLHPLGGSSVVWEPVLERLAEERDVIAVDMPGFGDSPALANGSQPTPPGLASGIAAFLDSLEVGEAHLVGNSLGAWVAIELARTGRARSVTGLSPAGFWSRPLGPRRGLEPRTLARLALPLVPLLSRSARGRGVLLGGAVAHPERVPGEAAGRLVRAYAKAPAFVAANRAMRSELVEKIEDLGVPVTLAWAEFDRLVIRPKRDVPGARMVDLPGCGHIPTWDDPELVARVILEGAGVG